DIYRINNTDKKTWRLNYSADPALFTWLRGHTFESNKLPFRIESEVDCFRNFLSGAVNGLDHMRQFNLRDIHSFCKEQESKSELFFLAITFSEGMRYYFDENWVAFIDIDSDYFDNNLNYGQEFAKQIRQYVVLNVFENKKTYYTVRSGFNVDAGYKSVMIYNFQHDELNAERFSIKASNKEKINVIHACLARGVTRILPAMIGKIISYREKKFLPLSLSPVQVAIIFIGTTNTYCIRIATEFSMKGIRVCILERGTISERIKWSMNNWIPFYCIVGNDDHLASLRIESKFNQDNMSFDDLLCKLPSLEKNYNFSKPKEYYDL
ncbi:aminoacyl--tRNA ligase-related protein, partial [Xenorhabdus thuongxuanensis]